MVAAGAGGHSSNTAVLSDVFVFYKMQANLTIRRAGRGTCGGEEDQTASPALKSSFISTPTSSLHYLR